MQLVIANNSATNPLSVDLSSYVHVNDDAMDPASPSFTDKVISHSLLKEGGFLALTDLKNKELVFPLLLIAANMSATIQLLSTINQILESPGATCQWHDDNLSQSTYFDLAGGQFDVAYNYRKGQQAYTEGKLRLFAQPFGRTAGRPYAAASGVGPLLMISPYAPGGALAIGASTQASIAGFGGKPWGPSTGIFYSGNPSLAGDAAALLQVSYVGPLPAGATNAGCVPYVAVSVLPDANYQPLSGPSVISKVTGTLTTQSTAPNGQALSYYPAYPFTTADILGFFPQQASPTALAPLTWSGQHRLFGIVRASAPAAYAVASAMLIAEPGLAVGASTLAPVPINADWQLLDLGPFTMRASEAPAPIQVGFISYCGSGDTLGVDIGGFVQLPDNSTWLLNPTQIQPSQYGYPPPIVAGNAQPSAPYTNTLLLDDTLPDQFIYAGQAQTFAPAPGGMVASSARITQYSRGLVPRPDPKNGLPIIAILGVGQTNVPSVTLSFISSHTHAGASWTAPQNQQTFAQINVFERARYILP